MAEPALLDVHDLDAGYGAVQVLSRISLQVNHAEIVCVIGPNASGKSTILKALVGLIRPWRGRILFAGRETTHGGPARNLLNGMAYLPQGNHVFGELNVEENLRMGGYLLKSSEVRSRIEEVLSVFPHIRSRARQRAVTLSGGEQQLVSLARAMMMRPRLILLDEPTLGLSPEIVGLVFAMVRSMAQDGVSFVIVEHRVKEALAVSDRVYAIKSGRMAFSGLPTDLLGDPDQIRAIFA